jgi:hypothetical protein
MTYYYDYWNAHISTLKEIVSLTLDIYDKFSETVVKWTSIRTKGDKSKKNATESFCAVYTSVLAIC